MAGAVTVGHGSRRASRLHLPENKNPNSLVPVGDREFALMTTRGEEHAVLVLRPPDPLFRKGVVAFELEARAGDGCCGRQ